MSCWGASARAWAGWGVTAQLGFDRLGARLGVTHAEITSRWLRVGMALLGSQDDANWHGPKGGRPVFLSNSNMTKLQCFPSCSQAARAEDRQDCQPKAPGWLLEAELGYSGCLKLCSAWHCRLQRLPISLAPFTGTALVQPTSQPAMRP